MAWTFVQAPTPVITTGTTTATIALTSVTTGDLLVVVAKTDATGTISDNLAASGSWTEPSGSPWATNKHVYYKVSTATGAMTITVAVGGAAATIRVSARQYTPSAGTVSLDGAITTVTNAAAIASPISIGPTPSLLAGDLVVAGDAGSGTNTQSAGAAAPNTNFVNTTNANGSVATEDSVNWAGGAATATMSWTGTNQVDGVVIAFKITGGATATWTPQNVRGVRSPLPSIARLRRQLPVFAPIAPVSGMQAPPFSTAHVSTTPPARTMPPLQPQVIAAVWAPTNTKPMRPRLFTVQSRRSATNPILAQPFYVPWPAANTRSAHQRNLPTQVRRSTTNPVLGQPPYALWLPQQTKPAHQVLQPTQSRRTTTQPVLTQPVYPAWLPKLTVRPLVQLLRGKQPKRAEVTPPVTAAPTATWPPQTTTKPRIPLLRSKAGRQAYPTLAQPVYAPWPPKTTIPARVRLWRTRLGRLVLPPWPSINGAPSGLAGLVSPAEATGLSSPRSAAGLVSPTSPGGLG